MATNTLLGGAMHWTELLKTIDPSGGMAKVYNETIENNQIFNHMVWMPANQGVTHEVSRVAAVPSSSNKRTGVGIAPTEGTTVQAVEDTKVREAWGQIEDAVLQKHPNPEAYLQYKAMLTVQGMIQDVVQDTIYGNRGTTPDDINGLLVRHGTIQTDRKQGRVLSAAGSSNANSSIIGMRWGENGIYMTYRSDYPNGGLHTETFPAENLTETGSKIRRVVRYRVQFAFGIAEENRRYFFRLANIDASISAANWILNVENNLITLFNDAPDSGRGFVLYGNNFVKTQFDIREKDKGNVWFSPDDPFGQKGERTTMFGSHPVYQVERMVANEANVV